MKQQRKNFSHQSSVSVHCEAENTLCLLNGFLQADSIIMPEEMMGMNRYMFVNGSPVNFRDENGQKQSDPMMRALLYAAIAPALGLSSEQGAALGYMVGDKEHKEQKRMTNAKYAAGAVIGITAMSAGMYGSGIIESMVYPQAEGLATVGGNSLGQFMASRILNAGLGVAIKNIAGDIGYGLFKNEAGENLGKNAAEFGGGVGSALGGIVVARDTGYGLRMSSTQSLALPTAKVFDISGGAFYAIEGYIGCKYFEGEDDCRTIKWKKTNNQGTLK